jgi:hypothetical protein
MMNVRARPVRPLLAFAFGCAALAAVAQEPADYRNVTTGGSLRPGIYGRIAVRGNATPPPVIYPQPLVANSSIERVQPRAPVYLYVPPGQVRKWKQNCAKWRACDEPVLFVRVDQSPSRWGEWRQRRDELAWDPRNHPH